MMKKTLRSAVIASTPALLLASGLAHAVEFQAGNTTFSVEGYAKLDMIYDFDDRLGRFTFHDQIGADSSDSGHFRMQAGQSRIGFRSQTETDQGPLVLFANMDFFDGDAARTGSNSGGNPRLREVYGQWNGITAGRTWTTFNTFVGTPEILDFTNAVGQAGLDLQTQLRYTVNGFSIALEAPDDLVSSLNGSAIANAGGERSSTFGARNQSRLPDLTANYHGRAGQVDYAVGAMVRQLRVGRVEDEDGNTISSDSETGWGLFGAAAMEVAPGTTVRGIVAGGDGIGNYLYFQPAPAAYYDPNRENIETIEAIGGSFSITQEIGPGRATLAYAYAYADTDDFFEDTQLDGTDPDNLFFAGNKFQSIFVNYLWEPIERVTYGIELGWHRVDRPRSFGDDGAINRSSDDDAYRIMTSLIYDF
ncbi:porin [Methylonatrum kenyense]|uniref:DcaP family trimeric outer membrane transporter n=1 Tax=Methylonatrum kenyense TaxID=455253 RepID=UPI0020BEAB83|nr:DcaP family trimeric outer membrane transporter [Methylonatrum kenyense]MCK8515686.1 porin [Methylonatrum kenyense]